MEKLSVEELDPDHGEDEEEEDVDYQDVEDVLEWYHNAVEHSFQSRHSVDHFQWTQNSQQFHRLQLGSGWCAPGGGEGDDYDDDDDDEDDEEEEEEGILWF